MAVSAREPEHRAPTEMPRSTTAETPMAAAPDGAMCGGYQSPRTRTYSFARIPFPVRRGRTRGAGRWRGARAHGRRPAAERQWL